MWVAWVVYKLYEFTINSAHTYQATCPNLIYIYPPNLDTYETRLQSITPRSHPPAHPGLTRPENPSLYRATLLMRQPLHLPAPGRRPLGTLQARRKTEADRHHL